MKIVIKNAKDTGHTICRATGQKVHINPKSFVVIDTEEENEIGYWTNINQYVLDRSGLVVITDDEEIRKIESSKDDEIKKPETTETSDNEFYSEQDLLNMDKEDLFNICDNFNIQYKKNNSVKTLVKLILESVVK